MIIKKLTYIALALFAVLFLSACSKDLTEPYTPTGVGKKTPVGVTALLDAGGSSTRAANMEFASGDALLAYLRHVKWDGSTGARTLVSIQNSPVLVTFTKGSTAMTAYDGDDITPIGIGTALGLTSTNTQKASDLTADPVLYWDDFSANDKEKDNTENSLNIREDGHYLQSFYGYCFNGGEGTDNAKGATVKEHITSALVPASGVLGWQVATDQTTTDKSAFLHSDLLWSAEQTPVDYRHAVADRKGLVLPYTHAMSKVTINLSVSDGFADDFLLTGVTATLNNMFTRCTCTAPTYTLDAKGTAAGDDKVTDITMWQGSTETAKQCSYEAIVVPSILSIGNCLATLTGLDDNTYTIPVTEAILHTPANSDETGWGAQLTEADESITDGIAQAKPRTRATKDIGTGKGYEMKSGVNYVLNVTLNKQGITVSALIKDWIDVEAIGRGEIVFNPDKTEKGTIADELKTHGFDVYKNSVNNAFTEVSTSVTWSTNQWTYTPQIFWTGQSDKAYFRALSPAGTGTDIAQGTDILWAYACDIAGDTPTAAERAKIGTYEEVKISPRTGDVPLYFEHAMSKITVKLETASGDASSPTSPAVNLTGAKIEISNLVTGGSIDIVKGTVTPGGIVEAAIAPTTSISNYAMIPQTITDASIMRITLADGTTYRLQLNNCRVQTGTDPVTGEPVYEYISAWHPGKHYTYTIHIEKEAITFRAMIKEWEETNGGGIANLEWD